MIYLNEQTENQAEFENLLARTKLTVLKQLSMIAEPAKLTGADFEQIVFENIVLNASSTLFEGQLRHTEDREFPDIVVSNVFGIEVKATKKDDWTSIGNSVLESSRIKSVEKIYMFFGKLGGKLDITFRNYEDCLKGISVTHYPRYQIDMQMEESNSIFQKMEIDYNTIRSSSNPVKAIRKYYKKQVRTGEALWWIGDDAEDTPALSPIIKSFSALEPHERDVIKSDIFAYFPEVLSSSTKKYERIPAYLVSQYGVVTANLRDNFTAGGQVEMNWQGEVFRVPQIIAELCRLSKRIFTRLDGKTQDEIMSFWQKRIDNFDNAFDAWLKELDRNTSYLELPVKVSSLFVSSLEK